MKNFLAHAGSYILRGFLAITPLLLCVATVLLLYDFIDKRVIIFISHFVNIRHIPGLGIVLLLALLYLLGLILSNVVGKQILKFIESISEQIPIIKVIYGVGKQLTETLSVADPQKQAFKKAVLVSSFEGKGWMLGFVTGNIKDLNGEELLRVFVPSAPHPLTGIVFILKPSQVLDCGWTVEEALKMVVSIGIISPEQIKKTS